MKVKINSNSKVTFGIRTQPSNLVSEAGQVSLSYILRIDFLKTKINTIMKV